MNQLQLFVFLGIVEIAIKADPMKSGRQNMLQKQADEIGAFNGQSFLTVFIGIVFVPECNCVFINRDDPAVRDRGSIGIPCKIPYRVSSAVEGFLDEGKPSLRKKLINEAFPSFWIRKFFLSGEFEAFRQIQLLKRAEKFSAEHGSHCRFRKEETFMLRLNEFTFRSKPST